MKKILESLIWIFICSFAFVSFILLIGINPPVIGNKKYPFIVNKIKESDLKGYSKYYTKPQWGGRNILFFQTKPIILENSLYNIGDTITIK